MCGGSLTYFSSCHAGCSKANKTNKVRNVNENYQSNHSVAVHFCKIALFWQTRCYLVTFLCVISFQGSFSYSNCACVAKTGQTSGEATKGTCGVDCRLKLLLFLIILALMPFTACLNDIPATIVTLRFAMYHFYLISIFKTD